MVQPALRTMPGNGVLDDAREWRNVCWMTECMDFSVGEPMSGGWKESRRRRRMVQREWVDGDGEWVDA